MDEIKRYMKFRGVNRKLELKVIKWLDYLYTNRQVLNEENVLNSDLSLELRKDLAIKVHLDSLKDVKLFLDCEPNLLIELVNRAKRALVESCFRSGWTCFRWQSWNRLSSVREIMFVGKATLAKKCTSSSGENWPSSVTMGKQRLSFSTKVRFSAKFQFWTFLVRRREPILLQSNRRIELASDFLVEVRKMAIVERQTLNRWAIQICTRWAKMICGKFSTIIRNRWRKSLKKENRFYAKTIFLTNRWLTVNVTSNKINWCRYKSVWRSSTKSIIQSTNEWVSSSKNTSTRSESSNKDFPKSNIDTARGRTASPPLLQFLCQRQRFLFCSINGNKTRQPPSKSSRVPRQCKSTMNERSTSEISRFPVSLNKSCSVRLEFVRLDDSSAGRCLNKEIRRGLVDEKFDRPSSKKKIFSIWHRVSGGNFVVRISICFFSRAICVECLERNARCRCFYWVTLTNWPTVNFSWNWSRETWKRPVKVKFYEIDWDNRWSMKTTTRKRCSTVLTNVRFVWINYRWIIEQQSKRVVTIGIIGFAWRNGFNRTVTLRFPVLFVGVRWTMSQQPNKIRTRKTSLEQTFTRLAIFFDHFHWEIFNRLVVSFVFLLVRWGRSNFLLDKRGTFIRNRRILSLWIDLNSTVRHRHQSYF